MTSKTVIDQRLVELIAESEIRRMTAISRDSELEWLDVNACLKELQQRRSRDETTCSACEKHEKDMEQELEERDRNADYADQLTAMIGVYFETDHGEHSNMNEPWENAIETMCVAIGTKSAPRYLRPWVGTALMYSARMNLAISDQWCQGFNACLNAIDAAAGGFCPTDSEMPANAPRLPNCPECGGAYDGFCIACERKRLESSEKTSDKPRADTDFTSQTCFPDEVP